ncbi:MAG: dihydrodipicolinate synthase family protein [Phycisphaerales bacterium]|nr:dihydrodipicolinate synthase family protein [Phycisphaerales bacterium]
MNRSDWHGVIPAATTPFHHDLSIDFEFLSTHVAWMMDAGCRGVVAPGSLGEGATLSHDEKIQLWRTCAKAVAGRGHAVAAIASASTAEAVRLAREAKDAGCVGLMVLPPYVYKGTWRETRAHFAAVLRATDLSCMLYNNPIAYGTDVSPEQVAELAGEFGNLHAVKESSADVRRITAIKALLGDRLAIFVGVDDLIVEGIAAGATGWIAGLVNAMPKESVRLFELAMRGEKEKAAELYRWFLPLLRMDVVNDFVQLIKLVQERVGMGSTRVRPPRLELTGEALANAERAIAEALRTRR